MKRLLAVLAMAPLAALAELPDMVRAALAGANVPESAIGAVVVPADSGRAVMAHNAEAPMNPASVMKLATSYAALDLLGPAFTFRTDIFVTGEITGGVLEGDLVIRGGGDPKLTYERLWQLARQLRSRGLREIRGDVVIDRGYFAAAPHDPGRFDRQPRRAYNVGADAFLVNFQVVDFRFVPLANGVVKVTGEPDLPSVEIASRIRATDEPCGAWRQNVRHEIEENGLIATAVFSGTYPAACGERTWPLALFDGTRYTEVAWRWLWSEVGGVLRGKVRAGGVPVGATLFHRFESEPLANLVRDMNKHSNNVVARHLFLAISAEKAAVAGDNAASEALVRDWLKQRGVVAPELVVDNGSGLSRAQRASAATLAALLRSAWASAVMPEVMASLPIYGVDGTLRQRRSDGPRGQAHLKGGTLDDVQALAGYVLDARGRRWIVVAMVNHQNAGAAQPALDALVEWTYRSAGRTTTR